MRLQQVLLNYQSNALKFSPNNKQIEIICTKQFNQETENYEIQICVKDQGIGISEED